MEVVGGVASIVELSTLSLKIAEASRNLVQSFRNAPTEVMQLNSKLERLHTIIKQIDLLLVELPETESQMLIPPEHHTLLASSLQRALASLTSIVSECDHQDGRPQNLRGRLRWATVGKKKAERFLQDARLAELELDVFLQILTVRMTSVIQNSLVALSIGQVSLHTALQKSHEDARTRSSSPLSNLEDYPCHTRKVEMAMTKQRGEVNVQPRRPESFVEPRFQLLQHNMRRTLGHYVATLGNIGNPTMIKNGMWSIGAGITVDSKRKSKKLKALLNISCRLFDASDFCFSLQFHLKSLSWAISPRLVCSITVFNLRPSDAAIFLACRNGRYDEVQYLLESGQASIHDVDEETGGLLEHVLKGKTMDNSISYSEAYFLRCGQNLLEYLLYQGCDPSINHRVGKWKQPGVLFAFEEGFTAAVSAMIAHGADLDSFGTELAGLFETSNDPEAFFWKVRVLHSIGYSDWKTDNGSNNLLYGACWSCAMDQALFALEIANIDPNLVGSLERAPIGNAAQVKWLEGVAVLLEAGAEPNISEWSWNGTPLHRSTDSGMLTDLSHYLLLHGSDPRICDCRGHTSWREMNMNIYTPYKDQKGFSFIDFEGSLAHLLHHGADPFEVCITLPTVNFGFNHFPKWCDLIGYVRASDSARFWSYGIQEQIEDDGFREHNGFTGTYSKQWRYDLEEADSTRRLQWTFEWDVSGNVSRVIQTSLEIDEIATHDTLSSNERKYRYLTLTHKSEDDFRESDAISDDGEVRSEDPDAALADSSDSSVEGTQFFRNATRFYHHISTEQGRRQLSRFPMVRALCDALEHAGYRAEMDDDGDIWYDCDDGDRYFDACETCPDETSRTFLSSLCPICKDFEGYGLGHVLQTAETAKEQLFEYRRKVKEGKRNLFH